MKNELKIGYITTEDPRDRRSWSGTLHHLLMALRECAGHVEVLGPLRPRPELVLSKAFNFMSWRLLHKRFNYRDSMLLSRAYARTIRERTGRHRFDLFIAPAGLATIAHLETDVPVIYINDRCLAGALGYHTILSDLFRFSRKEGLALEEMALARASLVIYGSHWAADAARSHYPQHAGKVHVLPFGANLEHIPAAPEARPAPGEPLKMLFIGVKWEEKGGPIAYETLLELKRRGIKARLVVCGCEPPPQCNDMDLVREGFLDKNEPGQRERLEMHLRSADLLIVPTRFEAYGIAFCEAAAYGVPVFATRTGGIPTIVEEGRTGHLFDLDENGIAYADKIQAMLTDPERWLMMRNAARARFEEQLNWRAFTKGMMAHMEEAGLVNNSR